MILSTCHSSGCMVSSVPGTGLGSEGRMFFRTFSSAPAKPSESVLLTLGSLQNCAGARNGASGAGGRKVSDKAHLPPKRERRAWLAAPDSSTFNFPLTQEIRTLCII